MSSLFRRFVRRIHSTSEVTIPPIPTITLKRRRLQSQLHAQIAFGANLMIMAVGLPTVWNYVVKEKWEAYRKAKEEQNDPSGLEAERLAIEVMVNERRKEKGLQPYPYHSYQYTLMDQQRVTASGNNNDTDTKDGISSTAPFVHSSLSHKTLWDHVERIHKQASSSSSNGSSSTATNKATVPVHASEDYIKASQAYFAAKGKLGAIKSVDQSSNGSTELTSNTTTVAAACH